MQIQFCQPVIAGIRWAAAEAYFLTLVQVIFNQVFAEEQQRIERRMIVKWLVALEVRAQAARRWARQVRVAVE